MKTVVIINREGMGSGDDALGAQILQAFLSKSYGAITGLESIVFYNGGVKLLTEDSPHLQALVALEHNGVDLIACGTCLDHFNLRDSLRVGDIGSMDSILAETNRADKIITI